MIDYLLVFFLSVMSGISMGYSFASVVLLSQFAMVLKFVFEFVEMYFDEPDA